MRATVSRGFEPRPMCMTAMALVLAATSYPLTSRAADSASSGQIEEIIVTAQRRQENLQEVPVSVEVTDSARLMQTNINSLTDLTKTDPSVKIEFSGRTEGMTIRGIGSGPNQSFDQSVAMFIDEVYHGRSRSSSASFVDLERVEVLKGPQSTYFGNNAIAGAFNIVTRKPTDTFEADARGLYGMGGQYVAEGAAGGPVSDKISMRAAVQLSGSKGWVKNVATGKDGPLEDDMMGRLTFLFKPTDDFDATLKAEAIQNKGGGYMLALYNCPPPAPYPTSAFCTNALAAKYPVGPWTNEDSEGPGQGIRYKGYETALKMNYQLGGHTLTSVTGYYGYDYNVKLDISGVPTFLVHAGLPEGYHQVSEEVRLASPSDQMLEYLAGAYLQSDALTGGSNLGYGLLTAALTPTSVGPYLPIGQTIKVKQNEDSYAVFGSLTWNIVDNLKLTGGFRSSWVKKDFKWQLYYGTTDSNFATPVQLPASVNLPQAVLNLGTPGALALNRSDNATTPSARLQYQFAPKSMVYFSYSEGFKAGGFNFVQNNANPTQYPFDPEHVKAYEIGTKNELFDNQLVLNIAAFRNDFTNLQVSSNFNVNGTFFSLVKNAATARTQGVELSAQWAVTDELRASFAGTYLDSKYLSYPGATATTLQTFCNAAANKTNAYCVQRYPNLVVTPAGVDFSGQSTGYAPDWSGNLTVTYTKTLAGGYRLTGEVSTYGATNYGLDILDLPFGGYVQVDTRLTLDLPGDHWSFDVIGKNLTNAIILGYGGFPSGAGQTQIKMNDLQPANFAFQARYRW